MLFLLEKYPMKISNNNVTVNEKFYFIIIDVSKIYTRIRFIEMLD